MTASQKVKEMLAVGSIALLLSFVFSFLSDYMNNGGLWLGAFSWFAGLGGMFLVVIAVASYFGLSEM